VYRRGDGYWVGQIEAGYYPNGRRRKARVVRRYKADVLDALDELRRQAKHGGVPSDTRVSLAGYLDWWLDEVKARDVSAGSLREYRVRVNRITPIIGKVKLGKLTPAHVTQLANRLGETRVSPSTARHTLATLRSALRWAVTAGMIARNPADGILAPNRGVVAKLDDRLEPAEVERVLALSRDGWNGGLWWLALTYGLRLSELIGLRWADVDFRNDEITVRRSKTAAGTRTLPLIPEARRVLRDHRRLGETRVSPIDGYVFTNEHGAKLRDKTVYKHWNRLLARAGVPHRCRSCGSARTCSTSVRRFHSSRHTAATMLLESGVPVEVVSAVLGHSSLGMTVDVYAKVRSDLIRRGLRTVTAHPDMQ
jgi:integrase